MGFLLGGWGILVTPPPFQIPRRRRRKRSSGRKATAHAILSSMLASRAPITKAAFRQRFGDECTAFLFQIAARAAQQGQTLYLVGGSLRDWLLGFPDQGLDLMLAGERRATGAATPIAAITFAREIRDEFAGALQTHPRFGTAIWQPPTGKAIDFASARQERYPRPGQLPQVRIASAEEDLWRRDFSINALALALHPFTGRWLDPTGGLSDLKKRQLRVLHPRSFRDDPTRLLRGLRLAARLELRWEEESASWARAAIPQLSRLSGGRLRAELAQILREARPEETLTAAVAAGWLSTIHTGFFAEEEALRARFAGARAVTSQAQGAPSWARGWRVDPIDLGWRLLTMGSALGTVASLAERFSLRKAEREQLLLTATMYAQRETLADERRPPATFTAALQGADEATRLALWVLGEAALRRQLTRYEEDWRWRKTALNGRTLRRLGLPPGPRYRRLLEELQHARWNGEVRDEAGERALLARLLAREQAD